MKSYDFRFDQTLIKSFIGKAFIKYIHAEFMYTNSVTCILGFMVGNKAYKLTDEYESTDFFTLDEEATLFRMEEYDWNEIIKTIQGTITENSINEIINKIVLVNDHTTLEVNKEKKYDMWDTKAIIFYLKDREICFAKQDCWFSQEIEIYKGYNLIDKISDGKDIINDFENNETTSIKVERELVNIQ